MKTQHFSRRENELNIRPGAMDRKYRHQQERIQTLRSCQASLIKWRLTFRLQVYLIRYLTIIKDL